jgi:hypothetical protein
VGSGAPALPGGHDIIERHMLQLDADPPGSGQADELPVGGKALVAEHVVVPRSGLPALQINNQVGARPGASAGHVHVIPAADRADRQGDDIPRSPEGMSTAEEDRLPDAEFAFPRERKEPSHDAARVLNAWARFDRVKGVTDEERDQAWQRTRAAARKYGIHMPERDWRELMR